MAAKGDLFIRNGGRVFSSNAQPAGLFFKFTGAADVEANGYALNTGEDIVTAVTRTAEGIIKIALRYPAPRHLQLKLCHSLADVMPYVNDVSDADAGGDPHIHVVFRNYSNPAAIANTDPDAVVVYARLSVDMRRGNAG